MGTPGQLCKVPSSYILLASSYMTGAALHPEGGTVVNG